MVDDEARENEGDLFIAAQFATPRAINFITTHGRGLVCLAMPVPQFARIGVRPLVPAGENLTRFDTACGMPIDVRAHGVTTGVSASDRSTTARAAIHPDDTAADFVRPGHLHTLAARAGGVLVRPGPTEAAVDFARLAGLEPARVICEIIRGDGELARLPDLECFAAEHNLNIVTIKHLVESLRAGQPDHRRARQHGASAGRPKRGIRLASNVPSAVL